MGAQDLDKAAECLMVKQSLHLTYLVTPPVAATLYQGRDWRHEFGNLWLKLKVRTVYPKGCES